MSHKATSWAFALSGLKPAEKLVLLCLADRHNNDLGCFPTQARVAEDANVSRASLNRHLDSLERKGLIRRVRRVGADHRQTSTRYIFAFEAAFAEDDGGADSQSETRLSGGPSLNSESHSGGEPCLNSESHGCDTNLEGEPGREPGKEEEDAGARGADDESGEASLSDDFWLRLLRTLGVVEDASPWWSGWLAREHVRRWRDDLGIPETRILAIAAETRELRPSAPDGPKALDRDMEREARRLDAASKGSGARRRRDKAMPAALTPEERAAALRAHDERIAAWILGPRPVPSVAVSNECARRLLESELVTRADMRAKGLPW